MNQNEATIHKFYTAFQNKDYTTMQSCYADDTVFNDPAFGLIDAEHARAMWEMHCKKAKKLSLTFGNIQLLDDEYATCDWCAQYQFGKNGRRVNNKIRAHLRLKDGLIVEHTDAFDFYKWTRMALGLNGFLFGWSNFMQGRIQKKARKTLVEYIDKNK